MRGKYLGLLAAGAALASMGLYAWQVETRWFTITRLVRSSPRVPPAFDGYRIAHISDLHFGVPIVQAHLPVVIEAVNRESVDLIAVTGDFGTGERDGLAKAPPVLRQLHAPDGVWAVLGNHDYYIGVGRVIALLDRANVGLLCNQHRTLQRDGASLVLAGIDDMVVGVPDLSAALTGIPDQSAVILMAHEPDFALVASADPRIVLQLSGHTHGGQIRLPGMRPPVLPKFGRLFPDGLYRVGPLALYVTRGTGTGRFALRFACRPEITLITLRHGEDSFYQTTNV